MNRDIQQYATDYLDDYGFEKVLVAYRRKLVLEQAQAKKPRVVLEIGCGTELMYQHYLQKMEAVECWLVVEPSSEFCRMASDAALPNMVVFEGFLEESIESVQAMLPRAPDMVICSSVLHEVPSVKCMLGALNTLMNQDSLLHVNVPNANSFHRRLAVAMGLIPALNEFSARNLKMQQHRVYDFARLETDLYAAGFMVEEKGGYFVKPFTHEQMEAIEPVLGSAVMDGLFELGRREPELACEIFVNARNSA